MTVGVYIIHCIPQNTYYVGESIAKRCRIQAHFKDLRGGYHANVLLQRAWNKYGADNFATRWMWECSPEVQLVLNRKELSALTRRMEADIGCAMILEGFRLYNFKPFEKWTEANPMTNKAVRLASSETAKKRWANPEFKNKALKCIIAANKKPERNKKISEALKVWRNSPAEKAKSSERAKKQWADPEKRAKLMTALDKTRPRKKVICVETGEIFESASAASRHIGKRNTAVITAIWAGKRSGGFTWRYLGDN